MHEDSPSKKVKKDDGAEVSVGSATPPTTPTVMTTPKRVKPQLRVDNPFEHQRSYAGELKNN